MLRAAKGIDRLEEEPASDSNLLACMRGRVLDWPRFEGGQIIQNDQAQGCLRGGSAPNISMILEMKRPLESGDSAEEVVFLRDDWKRER